MDLSERNMISLYVTVYTEPDFQKKEIQNHAQTPPQFA